MPKYCLHTLLKRQLKNGSNDLVTRKSGQAIRECIEKDIKKEKTGAVIVLDFSKIGIVDYSCADEIAAKLISRLIGGEYGEKFILLSGLNESQKENIEVALERKGLAVMAGMRDGKRMLIGNLSNYLVETLNLISNKSGITASDLSSALKLPANTSGTRLLNLYKKRLVKRFDEMRNGGRVWVYEKV